MHSEERTYSTLHDYLDSPSIHHYSSRAHFHALGRKEKLSQLDADSDTSIVSDFVIKRVQWRRAEKINKTGQIVRWPNKQERKQSHTRIESMTGIKKKEKM